jgi:hypothetical protein
MRRDSEMHLEQAVGVLRVLREQDLSDAEYRRGWLGNVIGHLEKLQATECPARSAPPSSAGTNPDSNTKVNPQGEGERA